MILVMQKEKCHHEDIEVYIECNGRHFNEKLLEFAVGNMTAKEGKIEPITKEKLESKLTLYGVKIENTAATIYDQLFAANMCKADYLGSSVPDELHLCKYVKDVMDDPDGYEGLVFDRWYADMYRKGISVDWCKYK